MIVREFNTTKHLQVISGVSHISYWAANFTFEILKYFVTGGLMLLIILAFDKYEEHLWILFFCYGFPMVAMTYLSAYYYSIESAAQNFIVGVYFIIGALAGSIVVLLKLFDSLKSIADIISYIFRLVPLFALANGYSTMLNKVSLFYANNEDATKYEPIDVLSTEYVGMDIIYLCFTFPLFIFMMYIKEMRRTKWVYGKFQPNNPDLTSITDPEVKNEIIRANKEENESSDRENNNQALAIKVKNVVKTYNTEGCFPKPIKAVRNISFCLEYGECFAMLGVNGAGKTTMFKCLTQSEHPEKGDILIDGKTIKNNFDDCRNLIGYCPQIDAIFEELTVFENLDFYAQIKGIPYEYKDSIIDSIIKEVNLSEYVEKVSGNLSGGNKRKLSVAIAMVGNPPIILLDEPSAGMDPEARRYMWMGIHKITKQKRKSSVILTTHSMEEAETLCQKIGIMVKGQFKCYGSSSVIKENYGTVSNRIIILYKYYYFQYNLGF